MGTLGGRGKCSGRPLRWIGSKLKNGRREGQTEPEGRRSGPLLLYCCSPRLHHHAQCSCSTRNPKRRAGTPLLHPTPRRQVVLDVNWLVCLVIAALDW